MGLLSFIKKKWDDWYYHDIDREADEEWDDAIDSDWGDPSEHSDTYFADADQRTVYVLECLGQMAEAAEKTEQYTAEYDAVTSLLIDMEQIEGLPADVRSEIMDYAQRIESVEKERHRIYGKTTQLTPSEVAVMEQYEDEIPEGINKIREAEKYRKLIKHDLKKLNNERKSFHIRKRNLLETINNSRGIAVVTAVAVVMCILLMLVLQMSFEMDVRIGYILAAGLGAVALTVIYVRYLDAIRELTRLSKSINKLITIHNTVKIRYINNTNLLQYLYLKFDVESSADLEECWNIYMDERAAREKDEKLKQDQEYYYEKLTRLLSVTGIRDPEIWTRQPRALYDKRETVEARHSLIARRQKLREQIEYNKKIATEGKDKIASLAKRYPKYASEISHIVSQYEGL